MNAIDDTGSGHPRTGPAVGVWTPALGRVPPARAAEAAREPDELGYGSICVPEGLGRDPFLALSSVLTHTDRLTAATGIANIWARDPVTTTNAARTLTGSHPGRVHVLTEAGARLPDRAWRELAPAVLGLGGGTTA